MKSYKEKIKLGLKLRICLVFLEKSRINSWIDDFQRVPILDTNKANLYFNKMCSEENNQSVKFWRILNFYKWYQINYLN